MKYFYLASVFLLMTSCTSIASVNWVQRPAGDNSSDTWVPECSNCQYVVNYKATQCPNPKDLSLIVWRDKDLFFEFPNNPQSDYKDEQLEEEVEEKGITSQDIVPFQEDDDSFAVPLENKATVETSPTSDFEDLDWDEDPAFPKKNTDTSSNKTDEEEKTPEQDDSTSTSIDADFNDIDW